MPLAAQLKKLLAHSAVYGAADVFGNLVNFLLVPLYTAYLSPADYGDLALLFLFGTLAKIVFRLGLDAGFFRIHYTLDDEGARRRLAGSVLLVAGAVGAVFFFAAFLLAPSVATLLLSRPEGARWVVLVAADVWLGTFAFVPLGLLRIQERPQLFSALAAGRHLVNTVLKVLLVVGGHGVTGVLASDLAATAVFSAVLIPLAVRHSTFAFSAALVRESLAFGLPKVPHGLLVQVLNLADRKVLDLFVTRAEVGLYQIGYTFGTTVKFALSAFEPAWQPFVYAEARKPEGPATLARVVTYALVGFVAVGLAVAVFGPDLLRLMTAPAFHRAAVVVPVVALAYVLHGFFLLTSIGIGISRQTRYYPLVTAVAAAVNMGANFVLVPSHGMMGAAWSTVFAYAAMAALGLFFSQRVHRLPFEASRLLRVFVAATLTYAACHFASSVVARGLLLALFPALLFVSGFLRASERASLLRALGRG